MQPCEGRMAWHLRQPASRDRTSAYRSYISQWELRPRGKDVCAAGWAYYIREKWRSAQNKTLKYEQRHWNAINGVAGVCVACAIIIVAQINIRMVNLVLGRAKSRFAAKTVLERRKRVYG